MEPFTDEPSASLDVGQDGVLSKPIWNVTRYLSRPCQRDSAIGQGVDESVVAHPDLGQALEVGIEHHVDLEPWVGQAEIDVVGIDDDPHTDHVLARHSQDVTGSTRAGSRPECALILALLEQCAAVLTRSDCSASVVERDASRLASGT
jgi:hypothetical protein